MKSLGIDLHSNRFTCLFLYEDRKRYKRSFDLGPDDLKRFYLYPDTQTYCSAYIKEIAILTSMKGISVFTPIALMADIATIERFPNSKHFTSYLRSAPGIDE